MLKFLRSLVGGPSAPGDPDILPAETVAAPAVLAVDGAGPFALARHLGSTNGLPIVDWAAVGAWIDGIADPDVKSRAWSAAELAWLAHLRVALGPAYRLSRLDDAVLLSTLEPNVAHATLEFMTRTPHRIGAVLDGIARCSDWGHDILIVFDDDEVYYRYVSTVYPDSGEFAASGGMYISAGCGHFATIRSDLRAIEPVIVHEMTHGCLNHLPIPAWLNEGLAVNTEERLSLASPPLHTPQQMHAKHKAFWNPRAIQEFWSGKSFLRPDDGNLLSYDLARILVSQFAAEWGPFKDFVLAANMDDGGGAAALRHLGVDLGRAVCAILEQRPAADWSPDPRRWEGAPERGAFRDA